MNFLEKESLTVRWCFPGWYKALACQPFGGYFPGHPRCNSQPQWPCLLSLGILLSIQDPNPKTPVPSLPHPLLSNLGYLEVLLPCEMPRGLWSRSSIPYRERETKKRDQVHLEGPVQTETKTTTPHCSWGQLQSPLTGGTSLQWVIRLWQHNIWHLPSKDDKGKHILS